MAAIGRYLGMLATMDTWTFCWEKTWVWLPFVLIHLWDSIRMAFHPGGVGMNMRQNHAIVSGFMYMCLCACVCILCCSV